MPFQWRVVFARNGCVFDEAHVVGTNGSRCPSVVVQEAASGSPSRLALRAAAFVVRERSVAIVPVEDVLAKAVQKSLRSRRCCSPRCRPGSNRGTGERSVTFGVHRVFLQEPVGGAGGAPSRRCRGRKIHPAVVVVVDERTASLWTPGCTSCSTPPQIVGARNRRRKRRRRSVRQKDARRGLAGRGLAVWVKTPWAGGSVANDCRAERESHECAARESGGLLLPDPHDRLRRRRPRARRAGGGRGSSAGCEAEDAGCTAWVRDRGRAPLRRALDDGDAARQIGATRGRGSGRREHALCPGPSSRCCRRAGRCAARPCPGPATAGGRPR